MKARNVVSAIGVIVLQNVYAQFVGYENINVYLLGLCAVIGWFFGGIIGRLISQE